MINYGIISYHRPECLTYKTLIQMGANPEHITVFLQDENDIKLYKEKNDSICIVWNDNKGVSQNRNNVLRYEGYNINDQVLLLDDDVVSFGRIIPYGNGEMKCRQKKIQDIDSFLKIIDDCFKNTISIGSNMFGVSPNGNALIAKSRLERDGYYSVNRLWQGGCVGHVIDKQTFYDENYGSVEDYELQLRCYSKSKTLLRRNDLTCNKRANRGYSGGLDDYYKSKKHIDDLYKLKHMYPDYINIKDDYSGVRQLHG